MTSRGGRGLPDGRRDLRREARRACEGELAAGVAVKRGTTAEAERWWLWLRLLGWGELELERELREGWRPCTKAGERGESSDALDETGVSSPTEEWLWKRWDVAGEEEEEEGVLQV